MRAPARGAATAVAVLLVAGCGQPTSAAPRPTTAEVRTGASCLDPDVLDALGLVLDVSLRTEAPVPTTRGLPPEDFVADTALVCDRGETLRDSDGRWWAVTATLLEGDLRPLVDVVARTTTAADCGTGLVAQIWLVDAMGEAVLLPREAACADDRLPAALADLSVVDRTEHPVALEQPVTAEVSTS